jgi:hypothetical protein
MRIFFNNLLFITMKIKNLKKVLSVTLLAGFFITEAVLAAGNPTAPGQNKIVCFSGTSDGGYFGLCMLNSNGAKGSATLDNVSNDQTGTTNPYDQYSGVYVEASTLNGSALSDVKQFSFNFGRDAATAGSPRFSLPVDTTGDGIVDGYVFISAYYCNDGTGHVDAINNTSCNIFTNFSNESFPNWNALVLAHPDWTVATDAAAFVIADDPGVWTVSNVKLGKAGK